MKIRHCVAVVFLFVFLVIAGPSTVAAGTPDVNYTWVQWYVECGAGVIDAQEKYNSLRKLQGASTVAVLDRFAISQVVQEYYRNENDGYFLAHLQACWQTREAWEGVIQSEKNHYCSN